MLFSTYKNIKKSKKQVKYPLNQNFKYILTELDISIYLYLNFTKKPKRAIEKYSKEKLFFHNLKEYKILHL